ncbi:MAG: Cof-type HAD-IIB family hydrolase [Rikenellaceae bacterium]
MIKAIFLDIDGTLVSLETHKIPASTIDALVQVKAKGIKIFIATGRHHSFINNLTEIQTLGLIDGYITMNGSCCSVADKVLFKNPIPKQDVREIAKFCEAKDCTCVFVGEHKAVVYNETTQFTSMFYDQLHVDRLPTVSLEEALELDTYQLSPFISFEDELVLSKQLQNCEIVRWIDQFADVGAKGNTKQLGIDKMIEHFGIELSETMAFGDGGNDITMLKHAAIGIAMGNAREDVKNAADYVTKTVDENGIAYALHHFNVI